MAFPEYFGRCLNDPAWLPFITPEPVTITQERSVFIPPTTQACNFSLHIPSASLAGFLEVVPFLEEETLFINDLYAYGLCGSPRPTRSNGARHRNVGRELVRRSVYWAFCHGLAYVETSRFTQKAAGFWFGIGFSPTCNVWFDWPNAGQFHRGFVTRWKERLIKNPNLLNEFARTPVGRAVLHRDTNQGVLDLRNERQRAYAFSRLKIS